MIIILLLIVAILLALWVSLSLCAAAKASDEQMERIIKEKEISKKENIE